jgi:cobaltochelatase CobN
MRAILLLLLCVANLTCHAAHLLVVTTGPVTAGKFRVLDEAARAHGLTIEARFVEKLDRPVNADFWRGADAVLFDTPARTHGRSRARQGRPGAAGPGAGQAAGALGTGQRAARKPPAGRAGAPAARPLRQMAGATTTPALSPRWRRTCKANRGRRCPASNRPSSFRPRPSTTRAPPATVFSDTAAYRAWHGRRATQPVVAIAFHQQAIAAGQTGLIDDLIARIEAAGALPLAFYSPVMDNTAITALLKPKGERVADVLINTQIVLNPEGRRSEFAALGIPVLQALHYKKGDEAAWRADTVGITLMDVPFYVSQPEYAGIHDIQVASVTDPATELVTPIADQAASVVGKAVNLARLAHLPNREKRVAVMFWNYPSGEKNLGASFMNLPESLAHTLREMKAVGYRVETPEPRQLTLLLQRLLVPFYRPALQVRDEMETLLREGLAEAIPMRDYKRWFDALPEDVQQRWLQAMGYPEKSGFAIRRDGVQYFVVPRLKLGNVTILPQPPRGEPTAGSLAATEKALYHSSSAAPTHYYMAAYLWLRQQMQLDALVHFGTHGTQEWLPGKERGLALTDYPLLALGDVPVIYPYIIDNIGEAVQTKRRGRAVNISHQTAPFTPAGLHESFTKLHDELHAWLAQDAGPVRDQIRDELIARVLRENLHRDMGWDEARMKREFRPFIDALHDHLHELAQAAQPAGLHTFGRGAGEHARLATLLMMLGSDFWEAAYKHSGGDPAEADEAIIANYDQLAGTTPYRLLKTQLAQADDTALPEPLRTHMTQARRWHSDLDARSETQALLAALAGQYIATSYGGDPIKNPDALPTGRNVYGFDPSRVPTKAAWEAGKAALDQLVAAHKARSGSAPKKLAFTLWSVETMRHQGMLEAQALWALGVEPVWDAGGRVTDVKLVPRKALGRARIDVVLSATGLYRDHFPNAMKQLARAAQLAAQAPEAVKETDNPVTQNTRALAAQLTTQGWSGAAAQKAAATRIYSAASGNYGSGLDDAATATDTWQSKAEGDKKLAELYLKKMQFAFGPDEADWGKSGGDLAREAGVSEEQLEKAAEQGSLAVNLYAATLKGTEAAVLARTSNLYGMLTTDDPFQYLGGIATAVRHLDGQAPGLYIANQRGSGPGRIEEAGAFLAKELATRQFHPGYIKHLMAEGYAGTLELLDGMNNFAGWTSVAREIVRDDQWQQFAEVYVQDKHNLGLDKWFEAQNPHAQAQMVERMLEAARHGYWQANPATVETLKARYRDLAVRYDVRTDNVALQKFAGLPGYGLGRSVAPPPEAVAQPPAAASRPALRQTAVPPAPTSRPAAEPTPLITGQKLQKVADAVVEATPWLGMLALILIALTPLGGALRQWRRA